MVARIQLQLLPPRRYFKTEFPRRDIALNVLNGLIKDGEERDRVQDSIARVLHYLYDPDLVFAGGKPTIEVFAKTLDEKKNADDQLAYLNDLRQKFLDQNSRGFGLPPGE